MCALLVALFHIPIKSGFTSLSFFGNAWLFVDFFFVLSGFVIAHAYGARLHQASDAARFVIKRFGRLWPLHVFLLGCLVAMELVRFAMLPWYGTTNRASFVGNNSVLLIFQNLALLQTIRAEPLLSWNGPSWSIAVEFWAYILFAMIAISSQKHGAALRTSIAAVSCVLVYAYSTTGIDVTAWLGFFRCFFGFFVGQLLYRLCTSPASSNWQSQWRPGAATAIEIASVLCVILFVSTVQKSNYSIAAPILFACMIYVFAPEKGMISGLMRTKPFDRLGRYSYSIYMVHGLVIVGVEALIRLVEKLTHVSLMVEELNLTGDRIYSIDVGGTFPMMCLTIAILAIVILVSRLTWRFIEQPGQTFFNELARRTGAQLDRPSTTEGRLTLPR